MYTNNSEYECWIEITANKEYILDPEKFRKIMEKCKTAGMTGMILSVKDTTGFVLYPSSLAPHYAEYDPDFKASVDYVEQCFGIIRECGMKCYAAFDVFTEGNKRHTHPKMKGICEEDFACEVYGLDAKEKPVICKSTQADGLITVGSIDDFGEIFVNPGNPRVCTYELSLIEEFAQMYHPDGIMLDRVRYVGLSTDFSELSRTQWEAYSGITDEQWPEDIYTIEKITDGQDTETWKEKPGRYFGEFVTYRMQVIHDFVEKVSKMLHEKFPQVRFMDYTGSWYPLYYQVGANWADSRYETAEFPWCDRNKLSLSAYAQYVDGLFSGCYYEEVTIEEAHKNKRPADWYSVEGAGILAEQVTCHKEGLVDCLFLDQYKDQPEKISQAIYQCMEQSAGCMLFDLSYLVSNDWWKYVNMVSISHPDKEDLPDMTAICKEAFEEVYYVTDQKLRENLLMDDEYAPESSFCIKENRTGQLIGFTGVKISKNAELYSDTAWISVMAVSRKWQGCGYGTLLLKKTLKHLRSLGVQQVILGQDFANFFSGIPAPDSKKLDFFSRQGFSLNCDEHYDLEADIINNPKIETFDTSPWKHLYKTSVYNGERKELLEFLHHEFPGRWEYEAQTAIDAGKDAQEILLLKNKDEKIVGYCMLTVQKDSAGNPTGYGGLGPIGIAEKIRGNHVGDYILRESLCQLKEIGVNRVNIDWTILKDFYGQFDFIPVRTYRAASIRL